MELFIIGPVDEDRSSDIAQYNMAKITLEEIGHSVAIPYGIDKPESIVSEIMIHAAHMLSSSKIGYQKIDDHWHSRPYYDAVALLDGWVDNKNAVLLIDLAKSFGLECKPWVEFCKVDMDDDISSY